MIFFPNFVEADSVDHLWPEGQMILTYHQVDAPPIFNRWRGLYVRPELLDRQVGGLKAAGVKFESVGDWKKPIDGTRRVVLTFDDAIGNVFRNGLPVLQKHGVKAITFVVAGLIGKWNKWDDGKNIRREELMDRTQLEEWLAAGHEIGSHTLTHPHLAKLPIEEARRQIIDSKKILEDMFGRAVPSFCYPFGSHNPAVRDLVREAGYECATGIGAGFNSPESNRFALKRVNASHRRPWLAALAPLAS